MPILLDVVTTEKVKVDELILDDRVFGAPVVRPVLYHVVLASLSTRRRGTASTKEKGNVRGGGKKPWKQKGTGRARAGSRRSPLWRGGGTVFGPHPRSYAMRVPREVRGQALRAALSAKASAGQILLVDRWEMEKPSTAGFRRILTTLGVRGKTLVVLGGYDDVLMRSARNLPQVTVVPAHGLTVSHLLTHPTLVLTREAYTALCGRGAA